MDAYLNNMQYGQFGMMRDEEKRQLRRQSIRAGLCVIGFTVVQYALSFLLVGLPPVLDAYNNAPGVASAIDMLYYIASMFLPFLLAYKLMNPQEQEQANCFQKPISRLSALCAIVGGFLICTASDFVTNYLLTFLEDAGFSIGGGTYDSPATVPEFLSCVLGIAVLPALVEEFAMRSVVLQPMRRFGDRYAILMSAFIFALMHGNLVQIPFALPVGIALGYFVVATGSIWVGIAIHFINNLYSVVLNYLLEVRPTAADAVYNVVSSITLVGGAICLVLFWTVCRRNRLQKVQTALTGGEKTRYYLFTLPMIIAVIALIVETVQLISYEGH